MNVVGTLVAFGLRQVIGDTADQVVDYAGQALPYARPVFTAVKKCFTDHSQALPHALARANDRAWQAVGLALVGDGLFDRVKDLFRDGDLKGVRDQIKAFLAATPTGLEGAAAGARLKAAEEWHRLRKGKRLAADALSGDDLAHKAASMERYGDPARLTAAAHAAVADTAAALKDEAPHLAVLLTAAPPDGAPLLATAFAFFFRREVETNPELAHGLSFDMLRRLSDRQERGFAQLEVSLGAHTSRVLDRLDGLFDALGEWFASVDAKLADIMAELGKIAKQRDVPTSPSGPIKVSVTDKEELKLLQLLRDQLRALPPELVAAADWSKLGNVLRAAGQVKQAEEAHEASAAAARAAADRAAEAEAVYQRFRDACETGDHTAALTAFCRAAELDPERFTPFDLHRYRPTAVLGVGGFGTVLRADDLYVRVGKERQPQTVAIKCVHDTGCEALLERDLSETFDEADTLSTLDHPGIVKTLNRGFGDPARRKRPYLVMEYFAGHTLQAWMKVKGTLPLGHVLRIARQIAEAVHQAHKLGIYHRDVKPANVMARFDKTTGLWQVKVIDFGLAVKVQAARVSVSVPSGQRAALDRSLAGTLRYAPPEQRNELDAAVGPYSDVYAFGKTCLDLLFGTTEPKSFDWKKLPVAYRDRLQELLERATVDDLEHRFRDFTPVLNGLAELLEGSEFDGNLTPPDKAKSGQVIAVPLPFPGPEKAEMKFAWCPPGTFLMGGNGESGNPQHRVTISKGFWMGVYPVTQAQWQAVMGYNPSNFPGADRPVEMVSWDDAQEFCQKMAELTGKPIRLPTEAEWEYACRAGTTDEYFSGNGEDALKKVGWYDGNSGKQTRAVGEKVANAWGIFDVHGNVSEWCQDVTDGIIKLPDDKSVNITDARTLRGGSWYNNAEGCRAAYRNWHVPGARHGHIGLRVCFRQD